MTVGLSSEDQKKKRSKERRKSSSSSSHHKKRRKSSSSPSLKKISDVKKEEVETLEHATPIRFSDSNDEVETVTVNVKKISPTNDPIVVSFPSGLPPSLVGDSHSKQKQQQKDSLDDTDGKSVRFAPDQGSSRTVSSPTFKWTKWKKSSDPGKTTVSGEDETCSYIASNDNGPSSSSRHDNGNNTKNTRLTNFYIGIYDKERKTLVLQPSAEKGAVYPLRQEVKAYKSSPIASTGVTSGMTVGERKRFLVESFGSNKKKKEVKSQQANIVNISNVIGSGSAMINAMEKQTNISQSNKKAIEATKRGEELDLVQKSFEEARRKFLPSFNEEAETPFDVYDAQEIAGSDVWDSLSRATDACVMKADDGNWQEKLTTRGHWNKSTLNVLTTVNGNVKKSKRLKYQIKTILLLRYLTQFHNRCFKLFLSGTEQQIAKSVGIPDVVCSRFLSLFATPTNERGRDGFSITKQLKDKRTIHLLILYVLSHGKAMKVGSINSLCQDIKLEVTDAARLLLQAGFKCKKNSSNGIISTSLSVPLTFPKVKILKKAK